MVIDMHVHPLLYRSIFDEREFSYWEQEFGMGHMGPMDYDEILAEMDVGKIDISCLLPIDLYSTSSGTIASNKQVASIVADEPLRFIWFASVDPHDPKALEKLEDAFEEGAKGLSLHPGKQGFLPDEPCVEPLYKICEQYAHYEIGRASCRERV